MLLASRFGAVVGVAASLAAPGARAHEAGLALDAALRHAELAFVGEVVDVSYRSSLDTGREGGGLPHTFVRFRVDEVLKGRNRPGSELVLRFLGGEDAMAGEFLDAEQPFFDLGDRDLLLVEGNRRKACPLVRCREGRFRLVRGLVFDEDGHRIVSDPGGDIRYGRLEPLPEAETHFVLGTTLRRVVAGEPGEGEPPLMDAGPQLAASAFDDLVARRVLELHTPDELAALPRVGSADPAADFGVRPLRPRPLRPPSAVPPPESPTRRLEDVVEEAMIALNGGDPRLGPLALCLVQIARVFDGGGLTPP
jgi:hypothetical protein